MTLLTPLGLLGLLGIAVLILIYLLKPNFQNKIISSTFVWKLSLKYRKKKIPISKLRNLILILCQILILSACAFILSKPANVKEAPVGNTAEVIAVIDASASMRAELNGKSRFDRAVQQAKELSEKVYAADQGMMSVVVADHDPYFVAEKCGKENKYILADALDNLLYNDGCSYGVSDVKGAMLLCEQLIKDNPAAKVYFYTDNEYAYWDRKVTVVDVTHGEEWNAAILDAYTVLEENIYSFYVDIACYGRTELIDLTINVNGANKNVVEGGQDVVYTYPEPIQCEMGETVRVVFRDIKYYSETLQEQENVLYYWIDTLQTQDVNVASYEEIYISIAAFNGDTDSIPSDNSFQLFNGERPLVRIQYASLAPNSFVNVALFVLSSGYQGNWDIEVVPVKVGEEPALKEFDFYVFEHMVPKEMPTDGVVIMINPLPQAGAIPSAAGIRNTSEKLLGGSMNLDAEEEHPIIRWVDVTKIQISALVSLVPSPEYTTLASCNGSPVLLVKDEPQSKVFVMGFSVHYSNQAITEYLTLMFAGIFEHFMPATVQSNSFEVNESITLNARGEQLDVYLEGDTTNQIDPITEFPTDIKLTIPGVYVLQQDTWAGKEVIEYIYVNAPAAESNIWTKVTTFETPYTTEKKEPIIEDWLIWIAAAATALMFIEWWLQGRENA